MNQPRLFPQGAAFTESETACEARFRLDANYPYFQGHFPERPIVPGVTQLGWVLALCSRWSGKMPSGASRLRFTKPVEPNQDIRVRIETGRKGIDCQVFADCELVAKGTLILE